MPNPTFASSPLGRRRWILAIAAAGAFLGAAAHAQKAPPKVVLDTSAGKIVLEMSDKAPKSVANFLAYVDAGFYDGTVFHRVIGNFMIQGGGMTSDLKQKPTRAPIANEAQNGLKNVRGALAMARTADPDSATAQFFIDVVDNPRLDYPQPDGHGYAVFGRVVEGMDVVDKIKSVPTGNVGMFQNVPLEPVVIRAARRVP